MLPVLGFVDGLLVTFQPKVMRFFPGGRRALCFGQRAFNISIPIANCACVAKVCQCLLSCVVELNRCWLAVEPGRCLRRLSVKALALLFYFY